MKDFNDGLIYLDSQRPPAALHQRCGRELIPSMSATDACVTSDQRLNVVSGAGNIQVYLRDRMTATTDGEHRHRWQPANGQSDTSAIRPMAAFVSFARSPATCRQRRRQPVYQRSRCRHHLTGHAHAQYQWQHLHWLQRVQRINGAVVMTVIIPEMPSQVFCTRPMLAALCA
jgi:hypothetical protein